MCLVEYQSFWTDPICSGWVQIILERSKLGIQISQEKSNLNLTKMISTHPKQFVPSQNNLDCLKSFWTYRMLVLLTYCCCGIDATRPIWEGEPLHVTVFRFGVKDNRRSFGSKSILVGITRNATKMQKILYEKFK